MLSALSLAGFIEPHLIVYFAIFFLIGFLLYGSLMLAVGAAVNDLTEAQAMQMPLTLTLAIPWVLWPGIARDPTSTVAIVASHIPPMSSFAMFVRLSSEAPPPTWEVWTAILTGAVSVGGAIWVSAKVFRIGILMTGRTPNLRTLVQWIRAA